MSCTLEKNQFILYKGDRGRGVPLKVRHAEHSPLYIRTQFNLIQLYLYSTVSQQQLSRAQGFLLFLSQRPAFCPIKHLSATDAAAIPLDIQQRGVDVGVAILLQTATQRVLLTRRAKELRIFPNVWVPPGSAHTDLCLHTLLNTHTLVVMGFLVF